MKLIEALRAIQWDVETGTFNFVLKDEGICAALNGVKKKFERPRQERREWNVQFYDLYSKWPYYSGVAAWPIPDPNMVQRSSAIFIDNANSESMWVGEYGKLRLDLLRFCIAQLEREYASN